VLVADVVEKVLDDRCFKIGVGRMGFGLVNRGLGLRGSGCSSTAFLRLLCTVGRAVVVRRRFGLNQLMSLGILVFVVVVVVIVIDTRVTTSS